MRMKCLYSYMKGGWIWPTMNSCILCQLAALLFDNPFRPLLKTVLSSQKNNFSLASNLNLYFSGLDNWHLLLAFLTRGKPSTLLLLILLPPVCSWKSHMIPAHHVRLWNRSCFKLEQWLKQQYTKISERAGCWLHFDCMASVANGASAFSCSWWTPSYSEITSPY